MARILVNKELASAALRDATTALKAATVVSAAAILSQGQGDLEANAKAAMGHFDAFCQKLNGIRDDALDRCIGLVEQRVEAARRSLELVIRSPERNGIDGFARRIGEVGHALQAVATVIEGVAPAPPFLFDQFFLESMNDLGQRNWTEGV